MKGLTTGRIVHYGEDCRAALVSHVYNKAEGIVALHVFRDSGVLCIVNVSPSEGPMLGHWHWIEPA